MKRAWLVIGLIASVALNLFLIGAAAGVVALGARMAREGGAARPGALVRASGRLPQPDRRDMRVMLREAWTAVRADVNRSRDLRIDAWGGLEDPKADPALVKLKLAQSRQLDISTRAQVENKVVDYVGGLSPDDRRRFAEGMRGALAPPPATPPASNATAPAKP